MRLSKIRALMYRDFLAIIRGPFRLIELFYFPITTVVIWGIFAVYARQLAAEAGLILLIVNIFWTFAQLVQTTSNVLMMEDIWGGSLKQVLMTGISEFEYMTARLLTSSIASVIVVALLTTIALPFGIDFFKPGMLMLIGVTLIGSLALGVLVAALVLFMGREYGFLVWSAIQLLVMFSAPFFPKEIFPKALLYLSYVMPFTAIFEAARAFSTTGLVPTALLLQGLITSVCYFILSWPVYWLSFRRARRTGMLARLS